jgi:integrase
MPSNIAATLAQLNDGLRASGVRLRLELRGQRLGIRGPLPPRSGGTELTVQRRSLGLAADAAGLADAIRQLRLVQAQLDVGGFRWPQDQLPAAAGSQAVAGALERFERNFFADPRRRRAAAGSRTTWTAAYRPYLRRLAQLAEGDLSVALFEQVLESYGLGTRGRQQCGLVLGLLARQEGLILAADWGQRAAGYGLHQARFRQLPSDAEILAWAETIPSPAWQTVFALMATYGLRNHEVFFTDFSGLSDDPAAVLRVLHTTKTGEHQVWPFLPEWVEHFQLRSLGRRERALPPVCTDLRHTTLQQVGRRVSEQFRRYGLPCTPYDLRHAWALRTIHMGLPDTVAARMMGHSVAVHTRTYHHWITRRDQQLAVDAALARRGA